MLLQIDRRRLSTLYALEGRGVDTAITALKANRSNLTTRKTLNVEAIAVMVIHSVVVAQSLVPISARGSARSDVDVGLHRNGIPSPRMGTCDSLYSSTPRMQSRHCVAG